MTVGGYMALGNGTGCRPGRDLRQCRHWYRPGRGGGRGTGALFPAKTLQFEESDTRESSSSRPERRTISPAWAPMASPSSRCTCPAQKNRRRDPCRIVAQMSQALSQAETEQEIPISPAEKHGPCVFDAPAVASKTFPHRSDNQEQRNTGRSGRNRCVFRSSSAWRIGIDSSDGRHDRAGLGTGPGGAGRRRSHRDRHQHPRRPACRIEPDFRRPRGAGKDQRPVHAADLQDDSGAYPTWAPCRRATSPATPITRRRFTIWVRLPPTPPWC